MFPVRCLTRSLQRLRRLSWKFFRSKLFDCNTTVFFFFSGRTFSHHWPLVYVSDHRRTWKWQQWNIIVRSLIHIRWPIKQTFLMQFIKTNLTSETVALKKIHRRVQSFKETAGLLNLTTWGISLNTQIFCIDRTFFFSIINTFKCISPQALLLFVSFRADDKYRSFIKTLLLGSH